MDEQELARLAEHAKKHPEFIAEFRRDPVKATRLAGFEVAEADEARLGNQELSGLSDDQVIHNMTTFFMVE
jgi:hypothetical protein